MCGIFGVTVNNTSKVRRKDVDKVVNELFLLSQSRGKEASGAIFNTKKEIAFLKSPFDAARFLKSEAYQTEFSKFMNNLYSNGKGTFCGHSRLVTNGSSAEHDNNQPIVKDGIIGIHNGIVVNDAKLWSLMPGMKREFDVDTEAIMSMIAHYKKELPFVKSVIKTMQNIEGVANLSLLSDDTLDMILTTNNGSLYYTTSLDTSILIFASERFILNEIIKKTSINFNETTQLHANTGLYISLKENQYIPFDLSNTEIKLTNHKEEKRFIEDRSDISLDDQEFTQAFNLSKYDYGTLDAEFFKFHEKVSKLRRCAKCVLPETMPFIEFDDKGICNYCRHYKKLQPKGKDALVKEIEQYKSANGSADCLMTFSGGRDSSYALHYAKKELGLNPIAYTYDWGVITDLGRRNQSRMCQQLGVEHIVVSADIKKKRKFIKQNVEAWLKKPDLGMVPLFMAGDKQYFYYANKIAKQNDLDLIFLNGVALEQTHFKYGFCNVKPKLLDVGDGIARLTDTKTQLLLAAYYLKQYIHNPSYINSSLMDTVGAFFSYYMIDHNYLRFFQYIPWDEKEIEDTLLSEYDWETLPGHNTTWRIGDGTSHFYNYIYYVVAGLTENDTFRSNQIREGMISREEATQIVERDNMPQWESIQWYCETMDLDFKNTISIINNMEKQYDY